MRLKIEIFMCICVHMYAYTHKDLKFQARCALLCCICVSTYKMYFKIQELVVLVSVCVNTLKCTYVCVHMYAQIFKASVMLRAAALCRANYGVSSSPFSAACDAIHTLQTKKKKKLNITSKASPFSSRCIARISHCPCLWGSLVSPGAQLC